MFPDFTKIDGAFQAVENHKITNKADDFMTVNGLGGADITIEELCAQLFPTGGRTLTQVSAMGLELISPADGMFRYLKISEKGSSDRIDLTEDIKVGRAGVR